MAMIPGPDPSRRVGIARDPGWRASPDAFGAPQAQVNAQGTAQMRQAGQTVFDIGSQMRADATASAVKAAENADDDWQNQLRQDDNSVWKAKGARAAAALPVWQQQYRDRIKTTAESMGGGEQARLYTERADAKFNLINREAITWVGRETERDQDATDIAHQYNQAQAGAARYASDPDLNMYHQVGLNDVRDMAARKGHSPEVMAAAESKWSDQYWTGVIQRAAVENPTRARELLQRQSGFLTPESFGQLDRLTKESSTNAAARGVVDGLMSAAPIGNGSLADRIIAVESGGDPTAKNTSSTATGAGQFINSTWLETVKKAAPDVAAGKSDAELLTLRSDPALSKRMVEALADDNKKALSAAGIAPTDGAVYLAHVFGAKGAIDLLNADQSAPVATVVSPQVMAANPNLSGKTVGDVAAWASSRVAAPSVEADLAKIRAIENPDVRGKAISIFRTELAMRETARREQEYASRSAAWKIAVAPETKSIDQFDPETWGKLSGETQKGISDYLEKKAKGVAVQPNDENQHEYYRLMGIASTDPDRFANMDLGSFILKLPQSQWQGLVDRQAAINKKDAAEMAKAIEVKKTVSELKQDIDAAGIKLTGKRSQTELDRAAAYHGQLEEALTNFRETNKRRPTQDEANEIGRKLLASGWIPGRIWDSRARLFDANAANNQDFYVRAEDIPLKHREEMTAILTKRNGKAPTDQELNTAYMGWLVGERRKAKAVLKEPDPVVADDKPDYVH